jgi:phage head maturation protease
MNANALRSGQKVYKNFKTDDVEDVGHNALIFTVSTNEIDRDGDVVDIRGMSLDSYSRNPVVLYGHDYNSLPVGRATRLFQQQVGDVLKLKARVEFTPDSAYGPGYAGIRGSMVRRMYANGFLNATSIGFAPWEERPIADKRVRNPGIVYTKSELLDISCVSVPANPGALMDRAANDPEYRTMFKSWANEAIRMCDGGFCSKDEDVYRVDEDILDEELARAVARFGDEETFLVNEDDLNDILNEIRLSRG